MKFKTLVSAMAVAGLLLVSLTSLPVLAQKEGKGATAHTKEMNDALYGQLPFFDKTDFRNAHKGFIAPLPAAVIKDEKGAVIWNPQKYAFIKEGQKAPDTVNPSLWRQAQLNNIGGLFEVTEGVYQIRNLDLSNMTIIEGKEGITVIDPLLSAETAKAGMDLYVQHRGKRPVVAVIYTHSHVDQATYVYYLGWFDGNPATLDELPPVEAAKKYVDYMGGARAILEKARVDYARGNYRWVAQVVSKVVFADPNNKAARELEADAFEQLGYHAESGPWRNAYLTGAQELRNGVKIKPTPKTASPDAVRAMSTEMIFDYFGVHLNGVRAANARGIFNVDLGREGGRYKLELENGVLNHSANIQAEDPDATITLSRETLNKIILKETTLKKAQQAGEVTIVGNAAKVDEMLRCMESFSFWFPVVTP
ncbi:TPA: MBL fold metallo-hydrolase [Enterobacter hormaechei subsp. xiangfangensis]|nr:MBL fold metallo-hydrolase [Enterobacter hormaechei subsp. xiangfangensis]HAV1863727.1 MBL fold metallo-hydrolase [Enterobacter hormaechei subsp. xiangfangensis]